jgi:hypothetical protein
VRSLLLIVGLVGLAAGFLIWLLPEGDATKSVSEVSTTKVTSSPAPTTTAATTTAQATPSTSTTSSDKTTETTTSGQSRRSDALIGGLLAVGAALILASAFYDRVTAIKAAGVELTLGPKVAEKLASKVTPETEEQRKKFQTAYWLAVQSIPPTSSGDDPVIEAAVDQALSTVDYE